MAFQPERTLSCLVFEKAGGLSSSFTESLFCEEIHDSKDHCFTPRLDAAQDLREQLDQSLLPLKEHLEKTLNDQQMLLVIADCIQKQSHQTKRQIQDQFNTLHQFLEEEEEARLKALKEEEEQKIQRLTCTMAAVSREIEVLSETIRATEEQLRAADIMFLLKYKAAVERVQCCPLLERPLLGPGALIDQAKHLGNLAFHIWSDMESLVQYSPVILDPNRATSEIVLLDDLTSLTTEKQAETDTDWALVLGSEGFDRGCLSWSVEVGNSGEWALGVMTDSLEKGVQEEDVEGWGVAFSEDEYAAVVNEEHLTSITLHSNPVRIRVCLDCDKHELRFYDADSHTHIHSFTQISPKKLFPYFGTTNKYKIRIQPENLNLV
ncbi:E3 ubiquitin-protein ligase TRIM35-like [Eucyclogobius newberryi]|uniref:E3 ubiquitin-protein ligase TRIM35-like n=1 Tax=Eucyclogobius newberryi TaxID=166745 RepID=UPI003B5BA5ED